MKIIIESYQERDAPDFIWHQVLHNRHYFFNRCVGVRFSHGDDGVVLAPIYDPLVSFERYDLGFLRIAAIGWWIGNVFCMLFLENRFPFISFRAKRGKRVYLDGKAK